MNDGQANLMAEMKKMQEMMLSNSSLSGRSDYGMIKEFIALQAEVKQMKEELENQKIKYKKMCDDQLKMQNELKEQKNAYEKVRKELAEQQKMQLAVNEKMKELEWKKKPEARDLKLHNHDDTIIPIEEQIVGKWKLVSSTGRDEYEKNRLTNSSYTRYRGKIDFDNREFTYDSSLTLKSYVDNNAEDPSFKSYYVKNRKLNYGHKLNYPITSYQWINVYLEKKQLVVCATIPKIKGLAICRCYYDRV